MKNKIKNIYFNHSFIFAINPLTFGICFVLKIYVFDGKLKIFDNALIERGK
jgi:hypothetical protein